MARFSAGALTTAGSTVLPILSIYAAAGSGCTVRAVGISNTTSSAVSLKLVRLTSTGTQGAGLTEAKHNANSAAAACTVFNTHSAGPALGDDMGYRWSLGAAIGAGVIETFGDTGLVITAGTANGIGIIVESGTGQPCEAYFVFDE